MTRLDDVQAAHDRLEAYAHDRQAPWIEHAAVPGLLAIARAAQAYRLARAAGDPTANRDAFLPLDAALADFEAGRDG